MQPLRSFRAQTLFVIRHGECVHNAGGWAAGTDDSPLTERGREHARANGRLLAEIAGPLDRLTFCASPLHRACITMELLREAAGLPPTGYAADRRLMEGDLGDHTRMSARDMIGHPDFLADPWNYVRPGGESLAMVHARVGRFLAGVETDCVIVTHALPVGMLRVHYLGLTPEAATGHTMANAGILRLADGAETLFGG